VFSTFALVSISQIAILVLYYAMAVLVQYPQTITYRIVLLPLIFQLAFMAVIAIDYDIAANPSLVSAVCLHDTGFLDSGLTAFVVARDVRNSDADLCVDARGQVLEA